MAGDDHRHASRLSHRRADRAEQHAGESPAAMTAHDDELGGLRLLDQLVCWRITDNDVTHPDIGITLLPRLQTL